MKNFVLSLAIGAFAMGINGMAPRSALAGRALDSLATQIVNPTHPVLFAANHVDQVAFNGWLGGASQQTATRYTFEASIPYELSDDRGTVVLRVNTPFYFNEPIPVNHDEYLTINSRFGDAQFDLYLGKTEASGLIWGGGIRGTAPSASNTNLGHKLWAAGPKVVFGQEWQDGILGASLSHQWDFAGDGKGNIDLSEMSYFYAINLGDGWQVSAEPLVSYDHTLDAEDRLSLPAGIGVARVARWAGLPWRFQLQYWNYLESADIFAPEHQLRFSMTPIFNAPWN